MTFTVTGPSTPDQVTGVLIAVEQLLSRALGEHLHSSEFIKQGPHSRMKDLAQHDPWLAPVQAALHEAFVHSSGEKRQSDASCRAAQRAAAERGREAIALIRVKGIAGSIWTGR